MLEFHRNTNVSGFLILAVAAPANTIKVIANTSEKNLFI